VSVRGPVTFLGSFPGYPPVFDLPEVAFAGRSNVGKSSAINTLLGQRAIARVSRTPGRTQLINLFRIGERLVLTDLPGYGYAKVPDAVMEQWKPMIEGYLGGRAALRLIIVLVDGSIPAQEIDGMLLDGLRDAGLPVLVVATKMDRLSKHQRKPALLAMRLAHGLEEDEILPFSSEKKEGVEPLWARIDAAVAAPKKAASVKRSVRAVRKGAS